MPERMAAAWHAVASQLGAWAMRPDGPSGGKVGMQPTLSSGAGRAGLGTDRLIARVLVGMILDRELAVSLFDLFWGRALAHTQDACGRLIRAAQVVRGSASGAAGPARPRAAAAAATWLASNPMSSVSRRGALSNWFALVWRRPKAAHRMHRVRRGKLLRRPRPAATAAGAQVWTWLRPSVFFRCC